MPLRSCLIPPAAKTENYRRGSTRQSIRKGHNLCCTIAEKNESHGYSDHWWSNRSRRRRECILCTRRALQDGNTPCGYAERSSGWLTNGIVSGLSKSVVAWGRAGFFVWASLRSCCVSCQGGD